VSDTNASRCPFQANLNNPQHCKIPWQGQSHKADKKKICVPVSSSCQSEEGKDEAQEGNKTEENNVMQRGKTNGE